MPLHPGDLRGAEIQYPDPLRIFIGWDSNETLAAEVCEWSIRQHARCDLEIRFLQLNHLRHAFDYRPIDRPASTEFAYTRFLVPWLCGYKGWALFLDCDILCMGDVSGLLAIQHNPDPAWLYCVPHIFWTSNTTKMQEGTPQKCYFRKLWSSVMLLNCEKFEEIWTKENVERASPAMLHGFNGVPADKIGTLDRRWNEVDRSGDDTILLHFTETNPWHNPGQHPDEGLWQVAKSMMMQDESA